MKGVEARGAQFAGVANIVGGAVDGFQVSGGLNAAGRNVEGSQASGGLNAIGGDLNGFQVAAGINVTGGSVRGFQASGGGNFAARNLQGLQITPGLNLVGRNVLNQGLQVAAGVNIAGNLKGTQISAAANIALGSDQEANIPYAGTQISMVNLALGDIDTQIGLLNIAGHVTNITGWASQRLRTDVRHPNRINQLC